MNSKLLDQKTEKHEIQMLICSGGLRADETWMSAETSWVRDVGVMVQLISPRLVLRKSVDNTHGTACSLCDSCA